MNHVVLVLDVQVVFIVKQVPINVENQANSEIAVILQDLVAWVIFELVVSGDNETIGLTVFHF